MALFIHLNNMRPLVFIIVCVLLFMYMDIPPWGDLPKSQEDAQLITEAITEAILAHEADPTAHLGDGESLEQHRINGVIDHPQSSVLLDKFTSTEITFQLFAGQGDALTRTGLSSITGPRFVELSTEEDGTQTSTAKMLATTGFNPFTYDRDSLFEVFVYFDIGTSPHPDIWAGITNDTTPTSTGYGFIWEDGVVKGFARFGSTTYYTSALTVSNKNNSLYRAQFVSADKTVYFFNNGELVGSLYHATNNLTAGTYIVMKLVGNGDAGSVCSFVRIFAGGSANAV